MSALKRLFREQPVHMGAWELLLHGRVASCWGLWPAWEGCCSASHGTGMLLFQLWIHPWAQDSGAAAAPRTGLSCLVAVPVVRRHREAGKVCGSSLEA